MEHEKQNTARGRRMAGVTLVELMVVIVIIGILATAVVINVLPQSEKARLGVVQSDFHTIENAVKLYRITYGRPPTMLDDLMNPPTDPQTGAPGAPLLEKPPRDPWGNEYYFAFEEGRPYISCMGPDGEDGTEDDIDNLGEEELGGAEGFITLPE